MAHAALAHPRLAIDGGRAIRQGPIAPWPHFEVDEIAAVEAVLRSGKVNYWTGEQGRLFEKEFAEFTGCKHALAVANGTLALELALYALGIGSGDEVIVPSRTFIASANCVLMGGGVPIFADVDRMSQTITAETILPLLTSRTKAIIVVHLAGWPCNMDSILDLAGDRGLKIIEDCAQAHGATYKGRPVGSFGDAAAFSFCQEKIMTTGGEGGMFTTNNESIWKRAWSFRDHGASYDSFSQTQDSFGFRWVRDSLGSNLRLTEMQSAIGRVQLRKLPAWVSARRRNASILNEGFSRCAGLRVVRPPSECGHSYYKCYVFVHPEQLRADWNRDRIMSAINGEGIPCASGICPELYLEKAFATMWSVGHRLTVASELGETSLMFPVHPTLSENDMLDICDAVEKVMAAAAI